MPGHFGGSHSHGDKKSNNRTSSNNNRESYRTSTSYQKSVSPSRVKSSKKEYELAVGRSRLDNLKVKKVPIGVPFSTILNAGQKFRQKTLDRNVEYFKGLKSRGRLEEYELSDIGYKEYIEDRMSGKITASGNPGSATRGGRDDAPPILQKKVVGGQTLITEAPTATEIAEKEEAEKYDARKTKKRGRRKLIFQQATSKDFTLSKPILLGV